MATVNLLLRDGAPMWDHGPFVLGCGTFEGSDGCRLHGSFPDLQVTVDHLHVAGDSAF
jgi:hypothetical protein